MSYARFGPGSDVYVYRSIRGGFECCGCSLDDYHTSEDARGMLAHLRRHRAAGHMVPRSAIERLTREAAR